MRAAWLFSLSSSVTLAGLLGCMGAPVPLSAQAGSTITIPLGSRSSVPAGYGGSAISDPQRGVLLYALETPTGPFPLITRASTLVSPHSASAMGGPNPPLLGVEAQVVSVVDIPPGAPHGTYALSVSRLFNDPATGEARTEPIEYPFQLSILPSSIDVVRSDGTSETITSELNPFEAFALNQIVDVEALGLLPTVIPEPELRLKLEGAQAWAVEIQISYPPGVIDIQRAHDTPRPGTEDRAVTWLEDDEAGSLTLHAVGTRKRIHKLSILFTLDDASSALFDPETVSIDAIRAWDKDGSEIAATASVDGVF